jgi:hypothetical protein
VKTFAKNRRKSLFDGLSCVQQRNLGYLKLLALTNAKDERAPRLVKYLLNNRKHASY